MRASCMALYGPEHQNNMDKGWRAAQDAAQDAVLSVMRVMRAITHPLSSLPSRVFSDHSPSAPAVMSAIHTPQGPPTGSRPGSREGAAEGGAAAVTAVMAAAPMPAVADVDVLLCLGRISAGATMLCPGSMTHCSRFEHWGACALTSGAGVPQVVRACMGAAAACISACAILVEAGGCPE